MAVRYTEAQLNTIDKSLLIQMFLNQQEQLETLTTEVRSLNEKNAAYDGAAGSGKPKPFRTFL